MQRRQGGGDRREQVHVERLLQRLASLDVIARHHAHPVRMRPRPAQEQRAEHRDRLLRGLERVLAPPEFAQTVAEIVERRREVGLERVGPLGGEAAVNRDRLLGGRERVLALADVAQVIAEITE